MHIYPCSPDLPPQIGPAFPLCVSHRREALVLHTSSKASCSPSPRGFLPPLLPRPVMPVQPPSQVHPREESGMRAASPGCPTSWHPGRAAPVQSPAWLTPSRPCGGSEYMLLWLPERKGFGEEEEKGGNRARKTTPGFLHPQETS